MSDPTPDPQIDLAKQRAALRTVRLIINAVSVGLIFTMLLAVVILVLEKRSGITLDGEQYRGLLLIIFLILTLSVYVVLEYFQHQSDEKAAKVQAQHRRKPKNQPAYAPIFAEPKPAPTTATPSAPPEAPTAEVDDDGLTVNEPSAVMPAVGAAPGLDENVTTLFIQNFVTGVAELAEDPSPFAQFGLRLYVVGACGEFVQRHGAPPALGKMLLKRMLMETGATQRDAASFTDNANTFAQVPHFRGPIDMGYRAMAQLHDPTLDEAPQIADMLREWTMQEGLCEPPEPLTFIATAIGVAMPGDATPQEDKQRSLRAHNTCVSAALERFQGREIHNLGNGIIAVFRDASAAVRAAENMLEQLDAFARENPRLTVLPHIGIDTEMTAAVNGAYISVALTRAVTIASLTPVNHIYCSEATCNDAPEVFKFEPVTSTEGFAEVPPVFSAAWSRLPAKGGRAVEYRQIGTMAS